MLLWGCALFVTLRKIKKQRDLLPNISNFILHGLLLVLYFIFLCVNWYFILTTPPLYAFYLSFDMWKNTTISYSIGTTANLVEAISICLVIFVISAKSKNQKENELKFDKYLQDIKTEMKEGIQTERDKEEAVQD